MLQAPLLLICLIVIIFLIYSDGGFSPPNPSVFSGIRLFILIYQKIAVLCWTCVVYFTPVKTSFWERYSLYQILFYLFKIPIIVPHPYETWTKKNIKGRVRQYFQPYLLQADIVAAVAAMAYKTIINAKSRNRGW